MILLLNRHSPEEVFLSGTTPSDDDDHSASSFPMKAETQVSEWSVCDDQSSLEALLNAEQARHIEPVEEVVDDMVATLRSNHIKRLRNGQCTVYAGLEFLDILINIERIADQCSNIGVYTLAQSNPGVMQSHHDYIQHLHQGGDPVFNAEYQEISRKYFSKLAEIEGTPS